MSTNRTPVIRIINQPSAGIAALTKAQILELVQDETLGGTQADVNSLQTGDQVHVTPSDLAAAVIDPAHSGIANTLVRVFIVTEIASNDPLATLPRRHALIEVANAVAADACFW